MHTGCQADARSPATPAQGARSSSATPCAHRASSMAPPPLRTPAGTRAGGHRSSCATTPMHGAQHNGSYASAAAPCSNRPPLWQSGGPGSNTAPTACSSSGATPLPRSVQQAGTRVTGDAHARTSSATHTAHSAGMEPPPLRTPSGTRPGSHSSSSAAAAAPPPAPPHRAQYGGSSAAHTNPGSSTPPSWHPGGQESNNTAANARNNSSSRSAPPPQVGQQGRTSAAGRSTRAPHCEDCDNCYCFWRNHSCSGDGPFTPSTKQAEQRAQLLYAMQVPSTAFGAAVRKAWNKFSRPAPGTPAVGRARPREGDSTDLPQPQRQRTAGAYTQGQRAGAAAVAAAAAAAGPAGRSRSRSARLSREEAAAAAECAAAAGDYHWSGLKLSGCVDPRQVPGHSSSSIKRMSGSYRVLWQQKGVLQELRKLGIECVGQWKDLGSRLLPLTSNPECAACGSSAAASAGGAAVLQLHLQL